MLHEILNLASWPIAVVVLGLLAMVIFRKPLTRLMDRTRRVTKTGLEGDAPSQQGSVSRVLPLQMFTEKLCN